MVDIPPKESPKTVNFDYIKTNNYHVAHADGAFIAGASSGLTISFYSERQPIPRRVVHTMANYELGEELPEQRVVRDALVRDVEVSFAMSLDVAKRVHEVLGEIITKLEDAHAQSRSR
jgi:hypothetical protein